MTDVCFRVLFVYHSSAKKVTVEFLRVLNYSIRIFYYQIINKYSHFQFSLDTSRFFV